MSPDVTIELFGFAVAILVTIAKKVFKKSKTCAVVKIPQPVWTVAGWLDRDGVSAKDGSVILYKRISKDFKTQEKTENETLWIPGTIQIHGAYKPTNGECGKGKFHACSRPYFCDEFRSEKGDIYVAIKIDKKDLHAWREPDYPHKIAFRKGKVLYQCDRKGLEIKK